MCHPALALLSHDQAFTVEHVAAKRPGRTSTAADERVTSSCRDAEMLELQADGAQQQDRPQRWPRPLRGLLCTGKPLAAGSLAELGLREGSNCMCLLPHLKHPSSCEQELQRKYNAHSSIHILVKWMGDAGWRRYT